MWCFSAVAAPHAPLWLLLCLGTWVCYDVGVYSRVAEQPGVSLFLYSISAPPFEATTGFIQGGLTAYNNKKNITEPSQQDIKSSNGKKGRQNKERLKKH